MSKIKVIHLQIGEKHYYFGSKKALCLHFNKEEIGLTYDSLRNIKISPNKPYINKKCIIREGTLISVSFDKSTNEID